jgi:anhydro-N-acetylmuramic acid kinase
MTVAGLMSGTSGDGIDVALIRIGSVAGRTNLRLLAHQAVPFSKPLREAVMKSMDAKAISTAELARLNWRLGIAYSEAVKTTLAAHPMKIDLIGCHGQTIYHQGTPGSYAGRKFACTWQIGEMATLAAETGVPVISNFRPADMIAGGQGAPLVSLLDFVLFHHATRGRVLQNLGGIGNLTAIPPAGSLADVIAFDTGPANMVIDALVTKLFHKPYDRGGRIAARGKVLPEVLQAALRLPFFAKKPPKSAGREEFGESFAQDPAGRRCRNGNGTHREERGSGVSAFCGDHDGRCACRLSAVRGRGFESNSDRDAQKGTDSARMQGRHHRESRPARAGEGGGGLRAARL